MANKKERTHGGKEKGGRKKREREREKKKRNNKQTKPLSEKKEEARNVSEQRVKGCMDTRNPCTRYNPLSRQQHGRAKDAHEQRQNERSR